jgi:hypothetical protein
MEVKKGGQSYPFALVLRISKKEEGNLNMHHCMLSLYIYWYKRGWGGFSIREFIREMKSLHYAMVKKDK